MHGGGILTYETNFGFESDPGGVYVWFPSATLRYSVVDRLELSASTQLNYTQADGHIGVQSMFAGTRVKLNDARKYLPCFVLNAGLVVPMAATRNEVGSYWSPEFSLVAEQDLSDRISTQYTAGLLFEPTDFSRTFLSTFNVEYDIRRNATIYADLYYQQNKKPDVRIDIGFNESVNKNTQIDLSFGTSLTSGSPGFMCNLGIYFSGHIHRVIHT